MSGRTRILLVACGSMLATLVMSALFTVSTLDRAYRDAFLAAQAVPVEALRARLEQVTRPEAVSGTSEALAGELARTLADGGWYGITVPDTGADGPGTVLLLSVRGEVAYAREGSATSTGALPGVLDVLREDRDRAGAPQNALELRAVGLSDADILDLSLITAYFNFVNRLALGLGVKYTEEELSGYRDD